MSWFSEFIKSPLDYINDNPLKALALIGAPAAAIAAPFAFPALGGALGIGATGAGAAGAGAGAAGAAEGGLFGGLFGGAEAGLGAGGFAGGDAALASILGPEAAGGFGADALGAFAAEGGGEALGGGLFPDFGAAFGGTPIAQYGPSLEMMGPELASGGGDAIGSWLPDFGLEELYAGTGTPGWETAGGAGSDFAGGALPYTAEGGVGSVAPFEASASGGLPTGGASGSFSAASGVPGAGPGAGEVGWWDKLAKGGMDSIMKNPLGIALAGGGLAYNMMQSQKTSPEMDAAKAGAQGLGAQGQQLMSYLQSGTLPPGLKQGFDNAAAAAKAKIISNHARNGMPTNPNQNSALAQELNQVDLNVMALVASKGQDLLTSGMNATNMSNQLYIMLENLERQKSQQTGQAIANFAAALSGPRISINTGGVRA